jgi:hypothetical protein
MIDSIHPVDSSTSAPALEPPPLKASPDDPYPYDPSPRLLDGDDKRYLALVALIVPCVAADFALMPIVAALQGPPRLEIACAFALLGCTLAQGTALAAWLAWGDAPFLRRLAWHWGIAVGLYLIWVAGFALSIKPREFVEIISTILLAIPLVSIAAQLPLWIVRHLFGWRLIRESSDTTRAVEPPLKICDLMLATLLVGAAFALARLVPPVAREQERWAIWAIMFTVASGISTIAMLPAGPLLMRPRLLQRALFYGGLYAALLVSILWGAVGVLYLYASAYLAPFFLYVWLSALMLAFAATLILAAVAARAHGYRLVWGRRLLPR